MPNRVWKTVRIFISSPFRDMHAERDHLVRFTQQADKEPAAIDFIQTDVEHLTLFSFLGRPCVLVFDCADDLLLRLLKSLTFHYAGGMFDTSVEYDLSVHLSLTSYI
jgi:hypothetical protein